MVNLKTVIEKVRENGHLGWIKITDASKVVANATGNYSVSTTIFKQKNISSTEGDEILTFDNKKLNITALEKELKKYNGMEVNLYVGGVSFMGVLEA